MRPTRVAVIGAGPAGLAAADALASAGVTVDVLEAADHVGGLARSLSLWGHTVDLGPHRFFTRDPRVDRLWRDVVGDEHRVIERRTRIYSRGRLFAYPLRPADALWKLGPIEATRSVASWTAARRDRTSGGEPVTFEDWMVRRFGRRLYDRFFASYSRKLWGIPGDRLDPEFAAQRIQDFSLGAALRGAFGGAAGRHRTTLDRFAYPIGGTGRVYERLARRIKRAGGRVHLGARVERVRHDGRRVTGVAVAGGAWVACDHVISTMPLTLLVRALGEAPPSVVDATASLRFRNTVIVYLHVAGTDLFPDQWLYVHEPRLRVGRITNFRNWVPELCGPSPTSVLALEYWCDSEDDEWTEPLATTTRRAVDELRASGLIGNAAVLDAHVVRIPRCYPVYALGYKRHVATIADHLATFTGLAAIGRYGAFKYNNQDHSLLMGLLAADNVLRDAGHTLWDINAGDSPHEHDTIGLEHEVDATAPLPG